MARAVAGWIGPTKDSLLPLYMRLDHLDGMWLIGRSGFASEVAMQLASHARTGRQRELETK